jgi:hypothetical protein
VSKTGFRELILPLRTTDSNRNGKLQVMNRQMDSFCPLHYFALGSSCGGGEYKDMPEEVVHESSVPRVV